MSFKNYVEEHEKILNENERLDEIIVRKKVIDGTSGSPKVKTLYIDTDPNYKVVHHKKNGMDRMERRRITTKERNNLRRRKGAKGTKNRNKQKKSLKFHYSVLGRPERNAKGGIGKGDVVYRRIEQGEGGMVKSDKKALEKRKKLNTSKTLTGGPQKIWK